MTLLHLSRREFYRMDPGLFFDMVRIYKNARGVPEEESPWAE